VKLTIILTCTVALGCAQHYRVTKIDWMPDVEIMSLARLNDLGQVIGSNRMKDGTTRGFIWEQGTTTDIGGIGPYTQPFGINNAGTVVGVTHSISHQWNGKAFVWTRQTGIRFLFAGRGHSAALGISQAGDIVGSLGSNAFLLNSSGPTILEPHASALGSIAARGINGSGEIIGLDYDGVYWDRPVVWTKGVMARLDESAYHALDINDAGQIVGARWEFVSAEVPITWINRIRHVLPTLSANGAWASAINDRADIVGWAYTPDWLPRAVMWRNFELIDLNDRIVGSPDWQLRSASDINEKGQIVGIGQHDGSPAGFLLTPISRR
jgi:probable HAF family extracellular repeat protein